MHLVQNRTFFTRLCVDNRQRMRVWSNSDRVKYVTGGMFIQLVFHWLRFDYPFQAQVSITMALGFIQWDPLSFSLALLFPRMTS